MIKCKIKEKNYFNLNYENIQNQILFNLENNKKIYQEDKIFTNNKLLNVISFITLILIIFICIPLIKNISNQSSEELLRPSYSFTDSSGNIATMHLSDDVIRVDQLLYIEINTEQFKNEVISFDIIEKGFILQSEIIYEYNTILFGVKYDGLDEPSMELHVYLDNGSELIYCLFGYIDENYVYLNPYSYIEAYNVYAHYMEKHDNRIIIFHQMIIIFILFFILISSIILGIRKKRIKNKI